MEEFTRANTTITFSSGTIKDPGNEYDLIFYANFVPNLFSNRIDVIGEAGFDKECEKNGFKFDYYPDEDHIVVPSKSYRITVVDDDIFDKIEYLLSVFNDDSS